MDDKGTKFTLRTTLNCTETQKIKSSQFSIVTMRTMLCEKQYIVSLNRLHVFISKFLLTSKSFKMELQSFQDVKATFKN